jgi:hypothetical protein
MLYKTASILLLSSLVHSNEGYPFDISTPDEVAALSMHQEIPVNPCTGQLQLSEVDLVADGVEPVVLRRTYLAPKLQEEFHKKDQKDKRELFGFLEREYRGWVTYPHVWIEDKNGIFQLPDKNGLLLPFGHVRSSQDTALLKRRVGGLNNMRGDEPHPSYDVRNTKCKMEEKKYIEVERPDGTVCYYQYKKALLHKSI